MIQHEAQHGGERTARERPHSTAATAQRGGNAQRGGIDANAPQCI